MNTYLEEVQRLWKKLPAFLEKNFPFITSRYKNNKQAINEIGLGLFLLFVILCFLVLWSDTEVVSVTVDSALKSSTTKTTTNHGILDVLGIYLKIVGGTAILFGAYFAWKRLEVNQEGQITERFTRAIDQLGATHTDGRKNLEVRLGAIYALERIAKDSVNDHWPIMEVFSAYLKEHAPQRPEGLMPTDKKFVTPDTRAILNVIARRHWEYEIGTENTISLENLELSDTKLSNAQFKSSQIREVNISGVIWDRTNFENAHIVHANMRSSCFEGSNFKDTQLRMVSFENSEFEDACMIRAYIENCNFEGASMHSVQLQGAEFPLTTGLTKEQIESTIIDRETLLPSYLMDDPEWYEAQISRSEEWLADDQDS